MNAVGGHDDGKKRKEKGSPKSRKTLVARAKGYLFFFFALWDTDTV